MNHLRSGMESLLMGEGIGLMDSKDTYRENNNYGYDREVEHENPENERPELPTYEALIEMIGLDNIYAMMESKNNMGKQDIGQSLMMDDYDRHM